VSVFICEACYAKRRGDGVHNAGRVDSIFDQYDLAVEARRADKRYDKRLVRVTVARLCTEHAHAVGRALRHGQTLTSAGVALGRELVDMSLAVERQEHEQGPSLW